MWADFMGKWESIKQELLEEGINVVEIIEEDMFVLLKD